MIKEHKLYAVLVIRFEIIVLRQEVTNHILKGEILKVHFLLELIHLIIKIFNGKI